MALKMPKTGDIELFHKYLGAFLLVQKNTPFRQSLAIYCLVVSTQPLYPVANSITL